MSSCPRCDVFASYVRETRRTTTGLTRRERCCKECDYHWLTYEVPAERMELTDEDVGRVIQFRGEK